MCVRTPSAVRPSDVTLHHHPAHPSIHPAHPSIERSSRERSVIQLVIEDDGRWRWWADSSTVEWSCLCGLGLGPVLGDVFVSRHRQGGCKDRGNCEDCELYANPIQLKSQHHSVLISIAPTGPPLPCGCNLVTSTLNWPNKGWKKQLLIQLFSSLILLWSDTLFLKRFLTKI